MILTPATRLQDHPEALTLLKQLRHFGYSSAQITQALAHLDGDRPTEKAEDEAFFALLDSQHIDYAVSESSDVVVRGNLNLSSTDITRLPDRLHVTGWLDVSTSRLTALPDNLSIGDGLYLFCTRITTLPVDLSVGDDLDVRDTGITVIPGSVHVGGNIVTGAFRAGSEGGAA